jgi:thiol-disulfide isomerase/thioredoxin/DNA-binding ferritin-like protein
MTQRSYRFLLVAALICFGPTSFFNAFAVEARASVSDELTVGDKAPALDIEHWLQDGNGYFKPVKEFKNGNVYVVEFWATWCGPCRMSMPLIAELQNKYRGQNVQIIGVSDESTELIEKMMGQENAQVGKTFGEITAAYSLTTDPDGSVYSDYMEAAKQDGIPTAFIVGKKGIIEWIGSPFEMDQPLEEVVSGTWDRDAFKKEVEAQKQLQRNIEQVARLEEAGKYDEAIAFAAARIDDAGSKEISGYWNSIRHMLKLVSNNLDSDTQDYFQAMFDTMKAEKDLQGILQLSNELYSVSEMGGKMGTLGKEAIAVIEAIGSDDAPDEMKAYYHNTIAHVSEMTGDFKRAVAEQEKAMELLDARQQRRMMPYLKELREKAEPGDEE